MQRRRRKRKLNYKPLILIGVLTVILLAGIITAMVLGADEFRMEMTMDGPGELTLEYGQDFQDRGVHAQGRGNILYAQGKDVAVRVHGKVNTQKLGDYQLTYRARFMNVWKEMKRVIHVVDTEAPVITLKENLEQVTQPGQTYREEGFTAVDNHDGDITGRVERREQGDQIIYTVTDSSGNTAQAVRTIIYGDRIPPELTMAGEERINLKPGTPFQDPGCTAQDNEDGQLQVQTTWSAEFDPWIPGEYVITYRAVDSNGNESLARRVVTVEAVTYTGGTNGNTIYLTFDDGPSQYTEQLLDVLKKYNVKVTFFVTAREYKSLLPRIAQEGHTLAIHTATHDYDKIYASDSAFWNDFYTMQEVIQERTGQTATIMRFPGGSSNTISYFNPGIMTRLTQAMVDKGYTYFDWNVDSNDAGGATTPEEVFQNVIDGCAGRTNSVVLQHDTHQYSVDAVEMILVWGISNGYAFEPLTQDSPTCHHGVNN